jgi:hypothetical protein
MTKELLVLLFRGRIDLKSEIRVERTKLLSTLKENDNIATYFQLIDCARLDYKITIKSNLSEPFYSS